MKLEKAKNTVPLRICFSGTVGPFRLLTLMMLYLSFSFSSTAQQLDVGIFESATPSKIEVKLRPDFTIASNQTITAILYTIRWNDPSIAITQVDYLFPFFVTLDGAPVTYNGYTYQVFAATPMNPIGMTISPGQEILISSFTYTGGDCSFFELADDEWTQANNGGPYFEFLGLDYTGIIYEPLVAFGPIGGQVAGGGNIYFGQSTGPLTLTGHYGTIAEWQRQFNTGPWSGIENTSGLTVYTEIPGAAGTWRYRAALQEGSCPIAYSTQAEVNVSAAAAWLGATGTSWFDPTNWTSNEVPGATTDVDIPVVSSEYYPILLGFAECSDLHIFAGAQFTISSTGSFTAHGNVLNSGDAMGMRILSGPERTGSLIHSNPGVAATVEKYLEGWTGWPTGQQGFRGRQELSSVVEDQSIQPAFVSDPPLETEEFLKWDESGQQWVSSSLGLNPPLQWNPDFEDQFIPGRGYRAAYALNGTHQFQGYLNATDLEISGLTHATDGNAPYAGWHLLGNPFASAIDWNTGDWDRVNLGAYALRWNSETASYQVMLDETVIDAGSGFMVYCLEGGNGSLTIPAEARLHISDEKNVRLSGERIVLWSSDVEKITAQEIILRADENATGQYDALLDAVYFPGLAPSFYSRSDDNMPMILNTFQEIGPGKTISLGFEKNTFDHFTIELHESITGLPVYLLDLKIDSLHDLDQHPVYSFLSSTGDDPDRFRLQFETVGIEEQGTEQTNIYTHDGILYLSQQQPGQAIVEIYDLSGRKLMSMAVQGAGLKAYPLNLKEGFYMARLLAPNYETIRKILIQPRY
jgi:hypothetical protein